MLNKLLPIIITMIAVGGAGYMAIHLNGGPRTIAAAKQERAEDVKEGGVHAVEGEDKSNTFGYFDFQRNFIIPVISQERVSALVLLTVSIEMEAAKIEETQVREPRIRDAFMKTLLKMSHEGVFNQDITNPEVYNRIQEELLKTAKDIVDKDVKSILLVDFARQDQY